MKNGIALLMSFLLLYSNMGLYAATHFCGGEAVATQISFHQIAEGCGMPDAPEQSSCDKEQLQKASCCDNGYQSISTDELTPAAVLQISTPVVLTLALCLDLLIPEREAKSHDWTNYEQDDPPLRNIHILHEKFLI